MTTGITQGFLGPLFFVWIGLHVAFEAVVDIPLFVLLLIVIAFLGKLIGSGLPAFWLGLGRSEALSVGIGMSNRGAMELIVVGIAYEAGLFTYGHDSDGIVSHLFSALVLMGIITTLLSLVVLRRVLPKSSS